MMGPYEPEDNATAAEIRARQMANVSALCSDPCRFGGRRIASHRSPFCPMSIKEKVKTNLGKNSVLPQIPIYCVT